MSGAHPDARPFAPGPALLFVPGDRPERLPKALDRADAAILDLEDAVAGHAKTVAREAMIAADPDPDRVIVRVNGPETPDFAHDLAALAETRVRTVMVAKAEDPASLAPLEGYDVVALCETARGVVNAEHLAALAQVVALMWGAEDLVASLGGTSSRFADGTYRDVARLARSRVLLAAGAFGKRAIDAVHVDIGDLDGLALEAQDAAASGFVASACIHPGQVETIRAAYAPTPEQLRWARGVLAQAEEGAFRFEGRMIDEPILRHARSLVARAGK
ncbi:HpcH/HpaI aldolase/citrate lyase family protein [Microbacterium enclense]|uniref:Citrate lyase subunit beta / citryl-CoA lyase n=1 Tax=Microbacterium enclense TaxID=993073 RepID=A0A1G6PL86_9MICO|nr:CoA ester lyase [Microbacterium enclense]KSU52422.1 citrate lyase [Microbacterium enclense]SDC80788.1 citrate lyase subunit beta / citryl-CoA lyase [Microbacterium enclense]